MSVLTIPDPILSHLNAHWWALSNAPELLGKLKKKSCKKLQQNALTWEADVDCYDSKRTTTGQKRSLEVISFNPSPLM